jgi:hypothetical protein
MNTRDSGPTLDRSAFSVVLFSTSRKTGGTGARVHPPNACATPKPCVGSTMAPELPSDFKEFSKLLRSHGVEYLLIGRYAVKRVSLKAIS